MIFMLPKGKTANLLFNVLTILAVVATVVVLLLFIFGASLSYDKLKQECEAKGHIVQYRVRLPPVCVPPR